MIGVMAEVKKRSIWDVLESCGCVVRDNGASYSGQGERFDCSDCPLRCLLGDVGRTAVFRELGVVRRWQFRLGGHGNRR